MKPTRIRDLVIVAVVLFIVMNLVTLVDYGALPRMPAYAGVVLFMLAVVDGILAYTLRPRFEHRRGTTPVGAVNALRVVVLAKASAMLGAIMFGAWCGLLGYVLPRAGRSPDVNGDILAAVIGAVCAALLVATALWLERCCRVPEDRDQERSDQDQKP